MEDDEPTDEELATWPNCATPDCEFKCCTWSGTPFCFPCARRIIGLPELISRYNKTHERNWSQTAMDEIVDEIYHTNTQNPLLEDH